MFGDGADEVAAEQPECFVDLNLDQVVEAIVAPRDERQLTPFFRSPLRAVEAVSYRHEVFRDLESRELRVAVDAFADGMNGVRQYLTLVEKQRYVHEKQRWFLDAASTYCETISGFADALTEVDLGVAGF